MGETRVFLFDHASGFDWFYEEQDMWDEVEEYRRLGWLQDGDGCYSLPIPSMAGDRSEADQTRANEYLEGQDYDSLDGCVTMMRVGAV